jgi:hypothetical protein
VSEEIKEKMKLAGLDDLFCSDILRIDFEKKMLFVIVNRQS